MKALWEPKFSISHDDGILTAGSCFAQHIGNQLQKNGFSWIDSEPAPQSLPIDEQKNNGFGVFSFRTGNIYTPALLEQWLDMSLLKKQIDEEFFIEEDRYYDPLRPAINPIGFKSLQDMISAREYTLEAIHSAIRQANTFIFTLGLTEAWIHKSGFVYPTCPGTIKGEFLPELHKFHNYSYNEIVESINRSFLKIKNVNPGMRFILTVSPVPLTATFSNHHVLSATTYSKSTLRAAAGFLSDQNSDIDYFPSYELISSPLFDGRFFSENKRTVTPEGVAFVMRHFLSALDARHDMAGAEQPAAPSGKAEQQTTPDDLVCEDAILEQWSKKTEAPALEKPEFLLVGDSHMGMLADQLKNAGIPCAGGGIMWGSQWHRLQFTPSAAAIFIPTDKAAQELWKRTLAELGDDGISTHEHKQLTIITNIGCHSHMLIGGLLTFLNKKYDRIPPNIDDQDIRSYLLSERSIHLDVVRKLIETGHEVIWVSDPPAQEAHSQIYSLFDAILCEYFSAFGAKSFNARQWIERLGGWSTQFSSTKINPDTGKFDQIHGNDYYYRVLAQEITNQSSAF